MKWLTALSLQCNRSQRIRSVFPRRAIQGIIHQLCQRFACHASLSISLPSASNNWLTSPQTVSLKALSSLLSAARPQFIYSGTNMPAPCAVVLERFPRHTTSRRLQNPTWEERLPRRRTAYASTRTNILNWRNARVSRNHTTRPRLRVSGNTCRTSLRSVYYSSFFIGSLRSICL